jgi:hypothetical protein
MLKINVFLALLRRKAAESALFSTENAEISLFRLSRRRKNGAGRAQA